MQCDVMQCDVCRTGCVSVVEPFASRGSMGRFCSRQCAAVRWGSYVHDCRVSRPELSGCQTRRVCPTWRDVGLFCSF